MRKASLLFLFLLWLHVSFAQTGSVEGLITDSATAISLAGITIQMSSLHQLEQTNEFGRFTMKNMQPGVYQLIASGIGYRTTSIPVAIIHDSSVHVNLKLNSSSLNLSEVVIAYKKALPINNIAAVDIQLRPVNTSQDILRMVPGLFIAQHAGGGKAEQLFLRGYDADHGTDVAIAVDGMPVNMVSHAHGQGYADLHFLIPELIDKVDFDKGPYNTLKGNLATGGWVDFTTKNFLQNNLLEAEAGDFNYKRLMGLFKLFNHQTEDAHQQVYAATEYFTSDGYFDNPQNFHRFNLFGKYSATWKNNAQLFITASTFNSKWNASGQIPERAVERGLISRFGSLDNSEGGNTARTNINAKFSKLWQNNWHTTDQIYFSHYNFNLFSNFTFFLKDSINGDEINQREHRNVFGYTGTIGKDYFLHDKKATTELGYGFRYDDVRDIELNHVAQRKFLSHITQGDVKEANGFAFLQQTVSLNHRMQATAGLRFDAFNFGYKNKLSGETDYKHQAKSVFSPKLTLAYNASQSLNILLSNGIGFHSNDARVILNNGASNILPKVFGTDLSFVLKPTKTLLLKTTFWQLYSQQEFVYVGDEGIVEPAGKTRRIGIDFSGRYQLTNWLFADADLDIAKPRLMNEPKGADYVPLAPTFTSIGGISVKAINGLSASLRYRFMGSRPATKDYSVKAKGYFISDAVANYRMRKFELHLSLENIFNTQWNEAQFDTESRLKDEATPVSEIHFTPGTPRFIKAGIGFIF